MTFNKTSVKRTIKTAAWLAALAVLTATPMTTQAQPAMDCETLMSERLLDSNGELADTIELTGASLGAQENRPVGLVTAHTFRNYDEENGPRIGVSNTRPAYIDAIGTNAYRGRFGVVQTMGNDPFSSWMTDNQIYIQPGRGRIWTKSITWSQGWQPAGNMQCFPGAGDNVIIQLQRAPGRHMVLTLSPIWIELI